MAAAYPNQNPTFGAIRLNSASKMDFDQFLLLRVLWGKRNNAENLHKECTGGKHVSLGSLQSAKSFLDSFSSWQNYIEQIRDNTSLKAGEYHQKNSRSDPDVPNPRRIEGTFATVLHYQRRSDQMEKLAPIDDLSLKVIVAESPVKANQARPAGSRIDPQTPTRKVPKPSFQGDEDELDELAEEFEDFSMLETPQTTTSQRIGQLSPFSPVSGKRAQSYEAIEDEQIVNSALILFLQGLSLHHPSVRGEWSLYRQAFLLNDTSKEKIYEARVDGVFRHANKAFPRMIAEVKPYLRLGSIETYDKIHIQESAQLAAWVGRQALETKNLSSPQTYR